MLRSSGSSTMSRRASTRSGRDVLSTAFDNNLSVYSLAAVAAGVSMLAAAAPAEGKVVVTTKTIHLPLNQIVSLDLNRDGVTDFQFNLSYELLACDGGGSLAMRIPTGNGVVGQMPFSGAYVSALARGARIGPSANFVANSANVERSFVHYCSGSATHRSSGYWGGNPPNRYVGVKFLIHGATHYGWIRLSADLPARLGESPSATITAYGYETVANKPIKAGSAPTAVASATLEVMKSGQPSLGMLALGADGVAIWRRKETLSTT
jgi:hypothetical protein